MSRQLAAAAAVLLCAATSASAVTVLDFGSHTLSYNEDTSFGWVSSSFTSGGGQAGFAWTVPDSVNLVSTGPQAQQASFTLPSFTITANPGWTLSNPAAFFGNLVFVEVGRASTSVQLMASVSIDGGPAMPLSSFVGRTVTADVPEVLNTGYYGESYGPVWTAFNSLTVDSFSLVLSTEGGTAASITSQPQNKLEVSLVAVPVPEPETTAMLLAGLGLLGWLGMRRR